MVSLEEQIHDLLSNHPLAPLHVTQIYILLLQNGNNVTLNDVDAACANMDGKNHFNCEDMRCYSVKE